MIVQFWGAARSVTGSMHLLQAGNKKILLDCGLFQGRRKESFDRNRKLPFNAAEIDAMILSHAHIDHSGNIPSLVKNGFEGPIYCTSATRDLCAVMLQDSGHIQEKDSEFMSKRNRRKKLPPVEPTYTADDAKTSLNQFVGYGYEKSFSPFPGMEVTLFDAGHLLGSAMVRLHIEENGQTTKLGFSGDLGRKNLPILRDPYQFREVDHLICESTYGNKLHDPARDIGEKLAGVVNRAVEKNGKIIIPAFSVERTQEIVYHLHQLAIDKKIPEIPVFVDSPLSVNATEVFRLHPECYDQETLYMMKLDGDPFSFGKLKYVKNVEESKQLNKIKIPCIIISASGMCEAGRILHHLRNSVDNPNNTICIVGFMAEHTLGRRIIERREYIKIFGEEHRLKAEVVKINSFSGHADRNDLLEFVSKIGALKHTFLVHGEEMQSQALKEGLVERGQDSVEIPERGQKFNI